MIDDVGILQPVVGKAAEIDLVRAAPAAVWTDGDAVARGDLHQPDDFLVRLRGTDEIGAAGVLAAVEPHLAQPEVVLRVGQLVDLADGDVLNADDVGDLAEQEVEEERSGSHTRAPDQ